MIRHPSYHVWHGMKSRCFNHNDEFYKDYGGRGIGICPTWLGEDGFQNFARDMGPRPKGHSIDRIDNNGNYEPGNCRWAVSAQQNRNYRRNRNFTIGGQTKCLKDWCSLFGVGYLQTYQRLQRGWHIETALTAKPRTRKSKAFAPIAHEILNVLERESGISVASMMAEAA